jgi:hypothetical protein
VPAAPQLAANGDAGLDIATGPIERQHKFHRVIVVLHFPCAFCEMKAADPAPSSAAQQHNPDAGAINRQSESLGRAPDGVVNDGDLASRRPHFGHQATARISAPDREYQ